MFAQQQQRFPRPEFEQGYTFPTNQYINQRAPIWEFMDVAVLVAALVTTSWLAIKKRSRQGLIWMSVFSLAYFGFYRQGCICAIGSIQNVSMALFNENYSMPLPALLFFIIPLIAALLFGRVFCAGVCPLGAIQELAGFRMIRVGKNVEKVLTAIPFVYLGLAILFSATGSQFIICRYDPFVGIFRLNAPYTMIIFGSLLLVVGIIVNRPYCRYLCPYGVLLNLFSRFSRRHVTISPAGCRNCRLCEPSCPYNAIMPSDPVRKDVMPEKRSWKTSWIYVMLVVIMAASGAVFLHNIAPSLARVNNRVQLAREIRLENKTGRSSVSKAAIAFHESGKTEEQLFTEESAVIERFRQGAPWIGLFLGMSLGFGFMSISVRSVRTEYTIDRGRCVSCGKCFKYCPVEPNT